MVKNLAIITLLLLCLLGGLFIYDYIQLPSRSLVIFYTSNLRGQIKPFAGTVEDRQYDELGGLAFIKGFIKETSEPFSFKPENVLLLDTGDALFGTAEATLTMGEIPLKLMEKAGYDAMAIGNLEFEFGFDALKGFANSNLVPMLACNYRDASSTLGDTFKSGIIVEKGGVKVGIIGLGQSEISRNTRQDNIINLEVSDLQQSVQKTAAYLKENGAEIIVLLSHHPSLGSTQNLSSVFPDIDIIIGDLIGPASVVFGEKPLVCQTAPGRGAGVGIVKVIYQHGKWQIEQGLHRIFPIDSSKIKPDQELVQEISKFESKIDSLLDENITSSTSLFNHSFNEESTIGNLIADSMKEASGADVALTNSGGIKSVFNEGKITLRNLYEVLPFENNLITVELYGYQLEDLIEQSLAGTQSGFLQSSGIECTYSTLNPVGWRIIQIDVNGKPLEFLSTYTVAINDFMHSNYIDWPELAGGRKPMIKGMIRESFKDYLKKRASISPNKEQNYKENDDDVVIRVLISDEIMTLSKPIIQDSKSDYEYSRLLAEMIRQETGADFALVNTGIINKTREPLTSITVSRIFSDFNTKEGVSVVEMSGSVLKKIIEENQKTQKSISFAGFSLEISAENQIKIYPWNDSFVEDNIYKVAINENLNISSYFDSNCKSHKCCSDIRRTFINNLRKVDGQVELKRAYY